jgi:DNA repair protein
MIRQGFPCSEVAEPILFANFGEAVCLRCRSEAEDDFQYVVKEALRNEYLLSDYIIGTMRFITKPNPHNARWAPIKLYLRKQAEAKAVAKWGSMDALREELSLRQRRQFDRSLKKVKAALSGTGSSVDSDAHSDRPESLLSAALSRGGTASLPSNVVPSVPGATDYCGSMVSASDPKSRAKRRRKTSSLDGIAAIIRGDG